MTVGICVSGQSARITTTTVWPKHQVPPLKLPHPKPSIISAKRRLSLPCVMSPSGKHLGLGENTQYSRQQELFGAVHNSCLCSIGYFIVLISHLVFWISYFEVYMAIAYVTHIIIILTSTLCFYKISRALTTPNFHDKLYIAVTMQLAIFITFSLISVALLVLIGLVYFNNLAFQELMLWRKTQFTIANGSLTLFEIILEIVNIVMICNCRQQLIQIATQWSVLSWKPAPRSFSSSTRDSSNSSIGNPIKCHKSNSYLVNLPHAVEDTTIYYLDNIEPDSEIEHEQNEDIWGPL